MFDECPLFAIACALLVACVACGGELSSDGVDGGSVDGTGGSDAGVVSDAGVDAPDTSTGLFDAGTDARDAAHDGDATSDAPARDAGDDAALGGYHDLTDPASWSTFATTSLDENARDFAGAAFDGRYIYFVPYMGRTARGSLAVRYDTQASFNALSSWSIFDTTTVDANAKGFSGAAFDGRYVYLVPYDNDARDGVVARYDTKATFTASSSWSTFDTTGVDARAKGFKGATFDGRYVYLVPNDNGILVNGSTADGVVARYDTQASFTATSSWSTFDTTTVNANAKLFFGGVFDGRFVYFVPYGLGPVTRYDTQASFTTSSSWSTFDTSGVDTNAAWFQGAAFDGRYVYLAPWHSASHIARYDTQASFTAPSAWSTFARSGQRSGTSFDGRYVYLIAASQLVERYDTLAGFTVSSSWSNFDTTGLNAAGSAYTGAVFDGRYVYLVPQTGVAVRFDAKTPRSMPTLPAWTGSFF
jgi:hypothetical protein